MESNVRTLLSYSPSLLLSLLSLLLWLLSLRMNSEYVEKGDLLGRDFDDDADVVDDNDVVVDVDGGAF